MYLDYWKLDDFPFENANKDRYFFVSPQHRMVYEDLTYGIRRHKNVVLLTGEIGCGKSTLLRKALLSLPSSEYDIALITYPRLGRGEILAEVARQLGIDEPSRETGVLVHLIQRHLVANVTRKRHTVVCIDDAQSIQDLEALEELRLMLNFELAGQFLITLVLVGQPELSALISQVPPLHQRVSLSMYLGPFDHEGTTRYILHNLRMAGYTGQLLTRQAVEAIYHLTSGVPRRINHLMDRCFINGMRKRLARIDSRLVAEEGDRVNDHRV